MTSYKIKLNKVSTFIFDMDGVLTDGNVLIYKDEFIRNMNSKDSYAIQYAAKLGYKIFIITGGKSEIVKEKLLNLGATDVFLGSKNKLNVYNDLKNTYNLTDEEILFMGDDIPDYPVLAVCGVACCPQDAAIEIKDICHYQSPHNGGHKCVRDVIEQTLRVQKKWFGDLAFEW